MREVPFSVWEHVPNVEARNGRISRVEQPAVLEIPSKQGLQQRRIREPNAYLLEKVALNSRVLVIEGISGSGKDTFQTYMKTKLKGRNVHDYSEGEVLLSWNQLQIHGISKLQIEFMKVFVDYMQETISRDDNSVFLLNRFHLSTYMLAIVKQPNLEREYDHIINILRTLPMHVFILQLDDNEIEKRSLHPERSSAWQKFQQTMVEKEGFRDKVERYIWQQRIMLESAEKHQIPYSVIKLPSAPEISDRWVRVLGVRNIVRGALKINATAVKVSRRNRRLPQPVQENNQTIRTS
jgi:thymidylate kinase